MWRLPPATSWITHDRGGFLFHHRLIMEVVGGFIKQICFVLTVLTIRQIILENWFEI
jgi:hypothetical protein